ncbi:5-(carboxyamino)imidazole ribonucleotide synthase [Rhodobium orientis]|uniref:N5-carboxyaminoimidazole ribonucleotide synthase n=1 Tax=Rhodobium orientis TaxID=34017 RepID=A0A327JSS5_9HYPH|nr:5-(carboxyamino)imidazole ribonucleotide synthase [Rhodobium orientis]MBB4302966.1 5-(carboxyamino)imidazole ribonucleotide synthase [Rhodobium orientis]MBK5949527.1 5-(carboxyamino)imidazole ribonucleotide synthase [Rhodobium orientis]RAI29317.1 5-(carboxyamino)imidazole ribonucleotide synthase [Rhodobium orientis]
MARLSPGDTIGILGGGQLGRMIAMAAARLGLKCHVYCPDAASPAFEVAAASTCAPYEDEAALAAFAEAVDVVTYEFENVPDTTAAVLAARVPVRPSPESLRVCQDRLTEKAFLSDAGIATAAFRKVDSLDELEKALGEIGTPAILKTRRFGYDGKGQTMIRTAGEAADAWEAIGKAPAILEAVVPFALECSAIVARGVDGETAVFDIADNRHENHILKFSRVPAPIAPETAAKAADIARRIAGALDHVGVLAVELFVVRDGDAETLFVNELAPRVHNSGHWTEDACAVSQFEQHVRAIAGWPLAIPRLVSEVEMENLIGADAERWADILAEPGARLHLYGKGETRPGRKMGHVNRLASPNGRFGTSPKRPL